MVTVPINLTGGTYKHKSRPLSAQVTRNFWPQAQQDASVKSPYILDSYPGKTLFGTSVGARNRGMKAHQGILYKLTDTTLYTVSSDGTHTSIGTIPGAARAVMQGIGSSLVIVTEGIAYEWDGATLTAATDNDFETPNSCAHLNNFMLYDGDGQRFASSDVGAPLTINALNYASAESNPDDLLRVYSHDQIVYMMGSESVEPWWNSGVGNPPFDRIEGSILQVGLGAIYSVASSRKFVYFMGSDNQVYAMKGGTVEPIFNDVLAREIASFAAIDDAEGICYNFEGQWMYELSFPTADRTFCYPEGGETFELSSGSSGGRHRSSSYAFAFRKHLVGDAKSGNIYQLDRNAYDENGEAFIRTRDTGPIHSGLFGEAGKRIEMSRFELVMETGTGILSGQGTDPEVMLSFSDDGGRTFGTELRGHIGKSGQYQRTVEWFGLGSFEERIIRISISDPVYCAIYSAGADLELGI